MKTEKNFCIYPIDTCADACYNPNQFEQTGGCGDENDERFSEYSPRSVLFLC